jgi:hypothetical protein
MIKALPINGRVFFALQPNLPSHDFKKRRTLARPSQGKVFALGHAHKA